MERRCASATSSARTASASAPRKDLAHGSLPANESSEFDFEIVCLDSAHCRWRKGHFGLTP